MNLVEYGRIILQRGWIMVLLAVIAAAGAFLFSQQMTPVYRASQTILIVPSRTDNGLTLAAIQLLNNRKAYLESDQVAARIIERLQLGMTPGQLRANTSIAANRDNLTIQIDVDLPYPSDEIAAAQLIPIAAEWGNELIRWQEDLNQSAQREDRIRAEPQDNPQLGRISPNILINTAIGGIAGFFLGAVIVFVLEFLESAVIRRRDDIERTAGMPVLATVPEHNT